MFIQMQVFSTRNGEEAHTFEPSIFSPPANDRLPHRTPLDPWPHQSKWSNPDESRVATSASHGLEGATRRPNRLKCMLYTPKMYPRAHMSATWSKEEDLWAHKGLVEPGSAELP
jgi:hypothetical protein